MLTIRRYTDLSSSDLIWLWYAAKALRPKLADYCMIPVDEALHEWPRKQRVVDQMDANSFNALKLDDGACFNMFSSISR